MERLRIISKGLLVHWVVVRRGETAVLGERADAVLGETRLGQPHRGRRVAYPDARVLLFRKFAELRSPELRHGPEEGRRSAHRGDLLLRPLLASEVNEVDIARAEVDQILSLGLIAFWIVLQDVTETCLVGRASHLWLHGGGGSHHLLDLLAAAVTPLGYLAEVLNLDLFIIEVRGTGPGSQSLQVRPRVLLRSRLEMGDKRAGTLSLREREA